MTCKDCLHFDVCNIITEETVFENKECSAYEDKSKWVHLPCKVGDVVYCYEPCFNTTDYPKLKVVEKEVVEVKTIATVFGLNFDVKSIGKTIFLTREEAEKELSKMRKEYDGK